MVLKKIFSRTPERELGFGNTVGVQEGERMMNPDGSSNVERMSINLWNNAYFYLVTMSWRRFILLIFFSYLTLSAFFGLLYYVVGVEHLAGVQRGTPMNDFLETFFFSTQTLTTVGYGRIAPQGIPANIIASIESLAGLMSFALISGLLYGRFSRPVAHVVFSEKMLVAPYKSGKGLMVRMINASRSELIETEVQVIMGINQVDDTGKITRRFPQLQLELNKISFFTLSWTVVHDINESSPIYGFSAEDLQNANVEIFVMVKGVDESNEQTVHSRRSYLYNELVWNAKFKPVLGKNEQGKTVVYTHRVGDYEMLA